MLQDISLWAAFAAGLVSFFSPCLLPLIPGYILFITGSFSENAHSKKPLIQTLGFVLGFTFIFILLGISASALGRLLIQHQVLLAKVSGLFIIFFGLVTTEWIRIPFLSKDYRKNRPQSKVSFLSAFGLGIAFAFGWTPCFGPILGAILAYTSYTSTNIQQGVVLLFTYSLGMAIPFLLSAIFIDFFEKKLQFLARPSKRFKRLSGLILILIGLLIFTGKLQLLTNLFY